MRSPRLVLACVRPPVAAFLLTLAACSAGPFGGGGPSSQAVGPSGVAAGGDTDLATQQACRQRVNDMYAVRERGAAYQPNSQVNTPYSANYVSGITSRGLSNEYAYEQDIAACERNARNGAEPDLPQIPGPPGGTPR